MLRRHFIINTDSGIPNIPNIPNNEIWYTSSDGNIVTPYKAEALPPIVSNTYVDGKGVIKFETDVPAIGNAAFYYCPSLTSITIPNSVTSIEEHAFFECSKLTSITIPNSVTSIEEYAFVSCSSLTSITLPNSVKSIGEMAFYDCRSLTAITIPNSVTSIGNNAFQDCETLTYVIIGNSVTSIGSSAFYECSKLTSVHITDLAVWCNIDFENNSANPLYYAHNLYLNGELVKDLVIPNSVTSIGDSVFQDCETLTSVTIPESVTSIGTNAFGKISAKLLFSKLYPTYTNKIFFTSPSIDTSAIYNVEFNISEIPTDYNISSMLPQSDGKGTITYNIYTDYVPCKDQALALIDTKTIVNVYHIDGTLWT